MDSRENDNTIILDHTNWDEPHDANEIYISDFDSMITVNGAALPTITIGTTGTGPNGLVWDDLSIDSIRPNNTLQLNGEGADVMINGESLMGTLKGIQQQLGLLKPNPELEAEWDELRAAGDRYRELEAQFKQKSEMWNTLKK